VFWATGAALFIRLKDYWEAGGLDGRFFAHMEEIDLCWRLRSRGRGIVCIPQSVVYHVGAATLKKENPRKTFLNFRNNLLMLYKNLPEKDLRRVMFVRGVLDGVAALVFLLKGEKEAAKAVLQARKEFMRIRPDFESSRQENMTDTVADTIPEKVSYSILWKYHACGKKFYSVVARTTIA
jgi:GT2 family glycosyltransferase